MQVGYVGLLKAINNFDPAAGRSLAAYAQPCITGEIKRHFRSRRWHAHVERSVQELVLEIREATGQLTQRLGHAPTEADLARHLGASDDALRTARRAEMALRPCSLDAMPAGRPSTGTLADVLGQEDPRIEHALNMQAVATHRGELPRRSASSSASRRCRYPGCSPTPSATSVSACSACGKPAPAWLPPARDHLPALSAAGRPASRSGTCLDLCYRQQSLLCLCQ
jgi:hypothetical protein